MKVHGHFPAVHHRHIGGQKVVQGPLQPFAGDSAFQLHTDTELPGVDAGVRAAAPLQGRTFRQDFIKGFLKHLLHRHSVLLHLPAVIAGAVVAQGDKYVAGCHRAPPSYDIGKYTGLTARGIGPLFAPDHKRGLGSAS